LGLRDCLVKTLSREDGTTVPLGLPVPTGRRNRLLIGLASVGALAAAWVVLTGTGLVSSARFPSPIEFWKAADQIVTRGYAGGTLLLQAWHSTRLVVLGFVVAVATGIPLGLLMGWSRRLEAVINPAFLLVRPIPPLAWIPLAIVWLGLGDGAKIMVIWFAAFVPSVINAYTGARNIDPIFVAAARVHGASTARILAEVVIPGSLPMIFTGLRLSLQASWTTLVAAELVGAFYGLGRVLDIAYRDIYPAMIAVAMVTVGVLGALTTQVLVQIEKWAVPWRR
jgi:NitT/TauT family transport system permease protein/taurine transport system permease protein